MTLTTEQLAILAHVVADPQAWADHAATTVGEEVVLTKIEKYRADWTKNKDLPGYKTAAERMQPAPVVVTWSREPLLKVVKSGREIALNRLAGIAFAAREAGDSATVEACLAARQSLLDITKLPAVLAATDDASLTAAIGAGYAAIVGACPVNIKSAFQGIQT